MKLISIEKYIEEQAQEAEDYWGENIAEPYFDFYNRVVAYNTFLRKQITYDMINPDNPNAYFTGDIKIRSGNIYIEGQREYVIIKNALYDDFDCRAPQPTRDLISDIISPTTDITITPYGLEQIFGHLK